MQISCLLYGLLFGVAAISAGAPTASSAFPSFHDTASPAGWAVVKGLADADDCLQAKDGKSLDIQTAGLLALPVACTVRFRVMPGDTMTVQALDGQKNSKPLLNFSFTQQADNQAALSAYSGGAPMATVAKSARRWDFRNTNTGSVSYGWRFPRVKNLWDERDFKEIGAGNAQLTPFADKVFTLSMVLTAETRQIWLDDRLVAEDRVATAGPARWDIQLAKTVRVLSADFSVPAVEGRFLPLNLDHYSQLQRLQAEKIDCALVNLKSIPMRVPRTAAPDIDLGNSLYRYRLTAGAGPDTGYVNAWSSWPGSFRVDPSLITFRVPYRFYQNAWLLAWVDDRPGAVAKATLRFFQELGPGYPASTNLEISPATMRSGLVTKLAQKTAAGKSLYLVKVPLDTDGLYGMRDRADQFLEFELSKPVAPMRSYPGPITYDAYPAGPPSALHVVGITLEEAPFGVDVEPKEPHFVFERPEKPAMTVSVTNTTGKEFVAEVRADTASFDGREKRTVTGRATIPPGQTGKIELTFDLQKLGWHALNIAVKAQGVTRAATLSLVLLPSNTRTYGNALNERRFGLWSLEGHYTSMYQTVKAGVVQDNPRNAEYLAAYRKLGLMDIASAHTIGRNFAGWNTGTDDPATRQKAIDAEVASAGKRDLYYFYGGEWGIGNEALNYGPWPLYTGNGDQPLDDVTRQTAETQVSIFSAIGKAIRASNPRAKLLLQWGAPAGSIAHLRAGMPKDLVDGFGMDAPMFELLPEISNATGSLNALWQLRAEAKRLGWPKLSIAWTEGPFFPTNPGALTERDQMDYQVRYLLLGMAYGVDAFISGVVPQDAGNYYGAEHYGAGIFHRYPLENPKPAAAAVATMTSMLCGADPVGGIDTGCLTTYCLQFRRAKDNANIFALWRVRGTEDVRVKVRGTQATVTDAMGNAATVPVQDGAIQVSLSPSPVWLTGVEAVEGFDLAPPVYAATPAKITRPLAALNADNWTYDGAEDAAYARNHFAIRRVADPLLQAQFDQSEPNHAEAVAITLPVEPGDRPLINRYGALKTKQPIVIPGKAGALGIWIKGNSSWGRVVYQLRDAKGEIWTSAGTKDDWNCDDTHAWSYINFDGWRYVRFPLPGNYLWDAAREQETTWWGSRGGDGIVDLPLTLEKIFVEARNEVPVLGEMKLVPERSYKLSGLVAEYATAADATPAAIAQYQSRMPLPDWTGPEDNPIAKLAAEGTDPAPKINGFEEPQHFNDGRQMIIRFDQDKALKYNLYLSRFADGRGADLIVSGVNDNQSVGGLRPETTMYLFLTAMDTQKKESKPSKAFQLVTHDKFLEK